MSLWIPTLEGRSGPVYRAIVDALAEDVASGRLPPGSRLPPHRDLAWRLKVTVGTIARAYAEAARQGIVSGEVGRGTFVQDPRSTVGKPVHAYVASRSIEGDGIIDMAINRPSGDNSAGAIAAAFRRLAEHPDLAHLLGYQIDSAQARYREAGAAWMAREGITAPASQVVVTVGGQQAIVATLAAVTRPGDAVLAEELTYPGLKVAAGMLDRSVEGVAMDGDGIIPDALEHAVSGRPGRVLYCMPTNQNPTALTMSAQRRQAIADVMRRHDGLIIEDGIYAFLADNPPPPLWTLAPERTLYISTPSKTVAPALRLGFVAAPDQWATRVSANVSAGAIMVPTPMCEVFAMLMENGQAFQAADAQKAEARARIALAVEVLGPEVCPPNPSMNLWLPLPPPWRADSFAAEAYRRGVVVSPAGSFATTRRVPEAVRVSVSAPQTRGELRQGLELLRKLLAFPPLMMGMMV